MPQAAVARRSLVVTNAKDGKTVVIGLAADSGARAVWGWGGGGSTPSGARAGVARSGVTPLRAAAAAQRVVAGRAISHTSISAAHTASP
jgi:hypothetical protein